MLVHSNKTVMFRRVSGCFGPQPPGLSADASALERRASVSPGAADVNA